MYRMNKKLKRTVRGKNPEAQSAARAIKIDAVFLESDAPARKRTKPLYSGVERERSVLLADKTLDRFHPLCACGGFFHADLTDDGRWCAACQTNGRRKYICGKTQSEVLAKRQMAAQIEKRLCARRKRKPNLRTERFTHILALFLVIFKESVLLAGA